MDLYAVILLELTLGVTLMRSLLVAAKVLPSVCGSCGRRFERRELGEPVCRCTHD